MNETERLYQLSQIAKHLCYMRYHISQSDEMRDRLGTQLDKVNEYILKHLENWVGWTQIGGQFK